MKGQGNNKNIADTIAQIIENEGKELAQLYDDAAAMSILPAVAASSSIPEDTPNEYLCPITGGLMLDPVVASDGHTYERQAITEWLGSTDCALLLPCNQLLKCCCAAVLYCTALLYCAAVLCTAYPHGVLAKCAIC